MVSKSQVWTPSSTVVEIVLVRKWVLLHTDCTCISVGKGMRWEPDASIFECIPTDKFNKEMKHSGELGMVKFDP